MSGALIGIALTVAVVTWAIGHILTHTPLVIASSAAVLAITWITNSAGVCLVSIVVAGVVVAFTEAHINEPKGDTR